MCGDYEISNYCPFQGKASKVASRSDPEALHVLLNCWSNLRFTGEDMDLCLRIMSGVLHLGNIEFGEQDVCCLNKYFTLVAFGH